MQKGAAAAAGASDAAAGPGARHGRMRRLTIADQYLLQQLKVCRPPFFLPLTHLPICVWHVYVPSLFPSLPPHLSLSLSLSFPLSLPPSISPSPPLLNICVLVSGMRRSRLRDLTTTSFYRSHQPELRGAFLESLAASQGDYAGSGGGKVHASDFLARRSKWRQSLRTCSPSDDDECSVASTEGAASSSMSSLFDDAEARRFGTDAQGNKHPVSRSWKGPLSCSTQDQSANSGVQSCPSSTFPSTAL